MMETTEVIEATTGELVVTKVGDDVWAGTGRWLVKERIATQIEAEMVGRLIDAPFEVPLARAYYRGYTPIILDCGFGYDGLLRVYERPDGRRVHIADAYLKAVETMCESDDDDGPFDYELHQRGGFRSPIGVFEKGVDLVAVVMPTVLINDHLIDEEWLSPEAKAETRAAFGLSDNA